MTEIQAFEEGELVRAELPPTDSTPTVSQISAVVEADRGLGLDLLRLTAGDENVMISPYSVATALGMLYSGARGTTAEEMAAVMHLAVDDEVLHIVRRAMGSALSPEPGVPREDDEREPFTIRPANSSWGQGGYPFSHAYLEVLARHYGAGIHLLDFIGDPAGSTEMINDWTEQATDGRIEDLIPRGLIDELTRLVLVNAIWFKANWETQFDRERTVEASFGLPDGSRTTVPMMRADLRTGYADTDLFRAVRLPYTGVAAMVVALPHEGSPSHLTTRLGPDDMTIHWSEAQVDLTLPSFQFESDVPLKTSLRSLGMEVAFVEPADDGSGGADFTGISTIRELFVTDALHKTFIAVDEHGTEAAAATALTVSVTSAVPPVTFTVDRPFLFWIEHNSTGEPLFLGQVTDPITG